MHVENRFGVFAVSLLVSLTGCYIDIDSPYGDGGEPHWHGDGAIKQVQAERYTPDFQSLVVDDGIEAHVVVDASQPRTVRLIGDENLVAMARTEMQGPEILHVFLPDEVGNQSPARYLRVEVTVPKLEALLQSGGGRVDLSGSISPEAFSLSAQGGTVRARGFDVGTLVIQVSAGAQVQLEGKAEQLSSTLSNGSTLNAHGFSAREASLSSSGGGYTLMQVSDSLSVTASGPASIRIIGRPTVVSQTLSGGAKLSFE